MRIELISVFVDDQAEALAFYTDVLGFQKRRDVPLGQDSWLTVVSPDDPDGPEVLLEPSHHPAVKPYRDALMAAGIPVAQFLVDDVAAEHERLAAAGVTFTQPPIDVGEAWIAVFDDTCGNLIQSRLSQALRATPGRRRYRISKSISKRQERCLTRSMVSTVASAWPARRSCSSGFTSPLLRSKTLQCTM